LRGQFNEGASQRKRDEEARKSKGGNSLSENTGREQGIGVENESGEGRGHLQRKEKEERKGEGWVIISKVSTGKKAKSHTLFDLVKSEDRSLERRKGFKVPNLGGSEKKTQKICWRRKSTVVKNG